MFHGQPDSWRTGDGRYGLSGSQSHAIGGGVIVLYHPRTMLAVGHDAVAVVLALLAAYWLRFNLDIAPQHWQTALSLSPALVLGYALVFKLAGLYRGIWRYASLEDLKQILLLSAFQG